MQTRLAPPFSDSPAGAEAEAILRSCVHCGFCLATCPTYQLVGDELDSPRGRIYLMKQVLEGEMPSRTTQHHLDRCLTCRACETTCPSGVRYGALLEIGREAVEQRVRRPLRERLVRWLLRKLVPYPQRYALLLRLGQILRPLLPSALRAKLPPAQRVGARPAASGTRRMLVLEGCVQSVATPLTNAAARRVLARLGIELRAAPAAGCCGALAQHLSAGEEARAAMRRNIDAWWPEIEAGAEAVVITASGCGAQVRDYGHLLADEPRYAARAARVSALARDLSEVLAPEDRRAWAGVGAGRRVAFHAPCTLQHGQRVVGVVEGLLRDAGFELAPVADAHLCCGSAGTYSILQPELSRRLRDQKIGALAAGAPQRIVTANIGCQLHLQGGTQVPVGHWIELFDES
jgi:Fe-S oxidoreductase